MALRQRKWARVASRTLKKNLGGVCALCGHYARLTFDVILPCDGGRHHRMEFSWRVSFYRQQAKLGNLQVLCVHCNARKGGSR